MNCLPDKIVLRIDRIVGSCNLVQYRCPFCNKLFVTSTPTSSPTFQRHLRTHISFKAEAYFLGESVRELAPLKSLNFSKNLDLSCPLDATTMAADVRAHFSSTKFELCLPYISLRALGVKDLAPAVLACPFCFFVQRNDDLALIQRHLVDSHIEIAARHCRNENFAIFSW
jgi:hypothetical protein